MKNKKGITLVALIITIILLLILVVVSINAITNEEIFSKAEGAVIAHQKAELREEITLKLSEKTTESLKVVKEDDAYSVVSSYDKDGQIRDPLGNPYIETEDGLIIPVLEIYNFNKEYLIDKKYPGAIIVSEGTEIETFQQALQVVSNSTKTTATIFINSDEIEWNASALIASSNTSIETLIITGKTGCILTFTGSEYSNVSVGNDANVIFKDITIKDATGSPSNTSWELAYLEFSGKLKFENCVFANGVMMSGNNTNVEIIGCTFHYGNEPSIYSLWLKCKTASVINCKFDGKRYIKVHNQYDIDIDEVTIENCEFVLFESAKPCLALGTIASDTSVTMKSNKIYYYENSSKGDLDNYVYESDTDTTTFTFVNQSNTLIQGQ